MALTNLQKEQIEDMKIRVNDIHIPDDEKMSMIYHEIKDMADALEMDIYSFYQQFLESK